MPDSLRPETDYSVCDYRSDELAKEMLANIIGEKNFDIDDIEWDDSKITVPEDLMSSWKTNVDPVTIEELTSRKLFGSGIFDALMEAVSVHLKREYDANRITGAEYAKAYVALSEAALTNAVQFTLNKNQAYFNGILAQAQAIIAGINAQIAALTAKVQLAKTKAEALGVAAQYALTAMKLSTEDAQHALVCRQQAVANAEIGLREAQADGEWATTLLRQYQAEMANPRPKATDVDADGNPTNIDYQNKKLQMEDQKAQTAIRELQLQANQPETPVDKDGNEIENGNIDFLIKEAQLDSQSSQADLYDTQSEAYRQRWKHDVASLFANQYTAMKSVDEGLALPKAFSGASINEVLQNLKVGADLGLDSTNIDSYTFKEGNTTHSYSGISAPNVPASDTKADVAYLQNGVIRTESEMESNKETEPSGS